MDIINIEKQQTAELQTAQGKHYKNEITIHHVGDRNLTT